MDVVSLALAKKYTDETAQQFGGLKGAPCQYMGSEHLDATNETKLKFRWTNDAGVVQESYALIPDGTDTEVTYDEETETLRFKSVSGKGDQSEIEEVIAEISEIKQTLDELPKERKFRPTFCHSIQNVANFNGKINEFKSMVDTINTYGVDGYILNITLKNNKQVVTCEIGDELIKALIEYVQSTGKEVWGVKILCTTYDTTMAFEDAYTAEVKRIATLVLPYEIKRIAVYNECNLIINEAHESHILTLISDLKAMGYLVSIPLAFWDVGVHDIGDSNILAACDFLSANSYPSIGNKGKATMYDDYVTAIRTSSWYTPFSTFKFYYPNKDIVVTEVGIRDYYECLSSPSDWSLFGDNVSGGVVVTNYLKANMEFLNDKVTCMATWYDIVNDKTKRLLKEYLGGEKA